MSRGEGKIQDGAIGAGRRVLENFGDSEQDLGGQRHFK